MPYRLTEFDGVPLPTAVPEEDLGTGAVDTSLFDSVGGVFDYYGSSTHLPRRHQFSHRGKFVGTVDVRVTSGGDVRVTSGGDVRVTAGSVLRDLQGKTDDLKSRIGVRGRLYRLRMPDDVLSWKLCRLLQVEHVETVENADVVSEVTALFETSQVGWRSEEAISTAAAATDGAAVALNIPNGGSLTVRDAVLTVAQTSGTITAVAIVGPGIDLRWAGSLGSGDVLTIDGGALTVQKNSADAYSGLTLGSNHTSDEWLALTPGQNVWVATVTGGAATVTMEHYNQWP